MAFVAVSASFACLAFGTAFAARYPVSCASPLVDRSFVKRLVSCVASPGGFFDFLDACAR